MNSFNKLISLILFITSFSINAQQPKKQLALNDFNEGDYTSYEINKVIPLEIRPQVLLALSYYPELKDIKIVFRFKKRNTPLTSRPRITHVFKRKKNRIHVITISTKTSSKFSPILFKNLPFNAQVGVLGHELGHITQYIKTTSLQLIGLSLQLFNNQFVDDFEFLTDLTSINHGLGYQLYSWSKFVRKELNITEWKGTSHNNTLEKKKERYMNPQTILKHIESSSIY